MAAEGEVQHEMVAHEKGYERFLWIVKWGTILSAIFGVIAVLVVAD